MTTATQAPAPATQADAPVMLQVYTVAPKQVEDTEIVICWTGRSTKDNPLTTENRYRGFIIHAAKLAIPDGSTTSKFHTLLQTTIHRLAKDKFADALKEAPMMREVQEAAYSLDAVLAYYAEEQQRSVINGERIAEWLKTSATYAALDSAKQKVWLDKVPKLAAPSYANIFNAAQAAAIIAKIADADADNEIALFIATRCTNIINKVSESNADAF